MKLGINNRIKIKEGGNGLINYFAYTGYRGRSPGLWWDCKRSLIRILDSPGIIYYLPDHPPDNRTLGVVLRRFKLLSLENLSGYSR